MNNASYKFVNQKLILEKLKIGETIKSFSNEFKILSINKDNIVILSNLKNFICIVPNDKIFIENNNLHINAMSLLKIVYAKNMLIYVYK